MTFFALLFAATPLLEAAACAADGCGPFCLEQADTTEASDATSGGDTDTDNNCMCSTGHCCHSVGGVTAVLDFAPARLAVTSASPIETEQVTSALPNTLDRPPRA